MAKKQYLDLTGLTTYDEEIKAHIDGIASGKANSSHNHAASNITSGTLSSDRLPTVPITKGGTGATTAAGALTNLGITATAAELNKLDGVTATATELNYVDGVTSNIQAQLDGLSSDIDDHTHSGSDITSGTVAAARLPNASSSAAGIVSTGSQTLAGAKTFSGKITASSGITTGGDIVSDTANTDDVGSTSIPFANMYTKNLYINPKSVSGSVKFYGSFAATTDGTATTDGYTELKVGNNTPTGSEGNARGLVQIYNSSSGSVTLEAGHSNSTDYRVYLPSGGGTLALNSTFGKSGSTAKSGLVPAPSTTAGTTKYLREDGTWTVPPDTNTTYTSLKNPYTLTIQGNGTTLTNGTYDGSAAKTVNITASSIGAAESSHSHSSYANQNAFSNVTVGSTTIAADTTTDTLTLVAGSNVTLTPDATNDKITIAATDTKYTHPSYTARTGVPTANATLSFGGTFNVSQPVSDATGHITAVNSRTYTMPSDRLFTTLTPTGTAIPQNANLATSTYLKVGRYYCSQDLIAATLKNAPTANAFMMEVYSPLSTTIDNESGAWVYRVRKITTYMGEQYIQYSYTGGTAGSWNHQPWRRIYHSDAITYGTAAPGGTAVNGDIYFREDIHATLPITEGGTGATSVSAARANLGLNHVGAAAVCKSDSRKISITTAGGFAVIPMVQSALQTNDSNFTISNNGIQCPYSGYVYITGAIYVSTSGLAGCYIYKNGDNGELHSQYLTCSGCISSGGMLVPVTAGDVITMKARSSVANPTIGGNNKGTHLSIIYVA